MPPSRALTVTLYRALYNLARAHDKAVAGKCLIRGRPTRFFVHELDRFVSVDEMRAKRAQEPESWSPDADDGARDAVEDALAYHVDRFLGRGRHYYKLQPATFSPDASDSDDAVIAASGPDSEAETSAAGAAAAGATDAAATPPAAGDDQRDALDDDAGDDDSTAAGASGSGEWDGAPEEPPTGLSLTAYVRKVFRTPAAEGDPLLDAAVAQDTGLAAVSWLQSLLAAVGPSHDDHDKGGLNSDSVAASGDAPGSRGAAADTAEPLTRSEAKEATRAAARDAVSIGPLSACSTATVGTMLVPHPALIQHAFRRSLVLLVHASQEHIGVIVNRPSPFLVGEHLSTSTDGDLNVFASNHLYGGGPVMSDVAIILHRYPHIEGATTVMDGVCFGGELDKMAALVRSGDAAATDFKFIVGSANWGSDQLSGELDEGAWVAAHGPGVVDAARTTPPPLLPGPGDHPDTREWLGLGGRDTLDCACEEMLDEAWRQSMVRLGGECALVADLSPETVALAAGE